MLAAKTRKMAAMHGADGQFAQPPHTGSVVAKIAVPEVFNKRAIVNQIANTLDAKGAATTDTVESVVTMVRGLATGVRAARLAPTQ